MNMTAKQIIRNINIHSLIYSPLDDEVMYICTYYNNILKNLSIQIAEYSRDNVIVGTGGVITKVIIDSENEDIKMIVSSNYESIHVCKYLVFTISENLQLTYDDTLYLFKYFLKKKFPSEFTYPIDKINIYKIDMEAYLKVANLTII